jgi:fluoride exporter
MRLLLVIGTGSFIGGVCRYLLSTLVQAKTPSGFPYGTLLVNLLGCFLIGVLFGIFERTQVSAESRLFLVTGVLGGFTTFSAFSGETYHLIKTGHSVIAITYVLISILVGISLTFAGAWIIKISIPAGN